MDAVVRGFNGNKKAVATSLKDYRLGRLLIYQQALNDLGCILNFEEYLHVATDTFNRKHKLPFFFFSLLVRLSAIDIKKSEYNKNMAKLKPYFNQVSVEQIETARQAYEKDLKQDRNKKLQRRKNLKPVEKITGHDLVDKIFHDINSSALQAETTVEEQPIEVAEAVNLTPVEDTKASPEEIKEPEPCYDTLELKIVEGDNLEHVLVNFSKGLSAARKKQLLQSILFTIG